MQNDVGAARRGGDRGMIAGIDLDRLGAGGRTCAAAPGRTRLATFQPALRKASAAA